MCELFLSLWVALPLAGADLPLAGADLLLAGVDLSLAGAVPFTSRAGAVH